MKYLKLLPVAALLLFGIFSARAQTTPGGVTGYTWVAWLTADNYNNGTWVNSITTPGSIGNFTQASPLTSVSTPQKVTGYNFQPAVQFNTSTATTAPNQMESSGYFNIGTNESFAVFVMLSKTTSPNGNMDYILAYGQNYGANGIWWESANTNLRIGWPNGTVNVSTGAPTDRFLGNAPSGGFAIDVPNYQSGNINWYSYGNVGYTMVNPTTANPTGGNGSINTPLRIGSSRYDATGERGLNGEIQEIIVVKKNALGYMNNLDIQKIRSYLAIKYGLTINNADDYVNTEGVSIYDRTSSNDNNGYVSDIFGIGRDDATNLNVVQSTSASSRMITVFKGTLNALNDNNNRGLFPQDKTFLVGGSNGVRDGNNVNYSYSEGVMFANAGLTDKINYHVPTVYKAQLTTGGVPKTGEQTVGIKINYDNIRYVLISVDGQFNPASTRIYPVVGGIANDVLIRNGEYLTLAGYQSTPGGINMVGSDYHLDLWVDGNHSTNTSWNNIAPANYSLVKNSTNTPLVRASAFNYHKELWFNNSTSSKLFSSTNYIFRNTNGYYVFVVSDGRATGTGNATMINFSGASGNSSIYWTGTGTTTNVWNTYWTTTNRNPGFPYPANQRYGIVSMNIGNISGGTITPYFNGRAGTAFTGVTSAVNARFIVGNSNNSTTTGTTSPLTGSIQEIILISRSTVTGQGQMLAEDLLRIHSYLALKYGITLPNSNYTSSAGASGIIWNATADGGAYNNYIFGVGRDDHSGLYQKQAHSVEYPSFVAYLGDEVATYNSDNTARIPDQQFLVFGSTSGNIASRMADANWIGIYENGRRLTAEDNINIQSRITRAQLTGATSMEVNLKPPTNDFGYVLVSRTAAFAPATTRIYPIESGFANVTITPDFRFIKFVGMMPGPGGIQDYALWLRADNEGTVTTENLPLTDSKLVGYPNYKDPSNIPAVTAWSDLMNQQTYSYAAGPTAAAHRIPVMEYYSPEMNYHPAVRFWGEGTSYASYLSNASTNMMPTAKTTGRHTAYFLVNNNFGQKEWFYALGFGTVSLPNAAFAANGYTGYNRPAWGAQQLNTISAESGRTTDITYLRNNALGNVVGRVRLGTSNYNTPATNITGDGRFTELFGTRNLFSPGATSMLGFYTDTRIANVGANPQNKVKFRFNAVTDSTYYNFNWDAAAGTVDFATPSTLGAAYNYDRSLKGVMSEAILFDRLLTAAEQRALESYLAFKYGITLRPSDGAGREDYVFSTGAPVWPGRTGEQKFVTFYNNISAVICDDKAQLNNRQSHSTDVGSLLHLGVAGSRMSFDGSTADLGELQDMEAIVSGHNGASGITHVADPGSEESCGGFTDMFNRIWLIHKITQGNRPISLLVGAQDNTSLTIGNDAVTARDYYPALRSTNNVSMLVAKSPQDFAAKNYEVVSMNYINGEHQCNYMFKDADTYITFAYEEGDGGCVGDDNAYWGSDVKKFSWSQWTARTNTRTVNTGITIPQTPLPSVDLGNNIAVRETKVIYDAGVRPSMGYPRQVAQPETGSLQIQRTGGSLASTVTTSIWFNYPVIPEFTISDLDAVGRSYDEVEIIGYCHGVVAKPTLSAMSNVPTFKINGNKATVYKAGAVSATNPTGKVRVGFSLCVDSVVVKYRLANTTSTGTRNISISPIYIHSVMPPPPINEDGWSFTKRSNKYNSYTCEEVEYAFTIRNTNCGIKEGVSLSDTLPAGMEWVEGSIIILDSLNNAVNTAETFNPQISPDGRQLHINNMNVRGVTTMTILATAVFDESAPSNYYDNRAFLTYQRIIEGSAPTPQTMSSVDAYTLVPYTSINVTYAPRPIPIRLVDTYSHQSTYKEDNVIDVTYTITNANTFSVTDVFINLTMNTEFNYVANSFSATSTTSISPVPIVAYQDNDPEQGLLDIAGSTTEDVGFVIPPGEMVIKFKIRAPNKDGLLRSTDNPDQYVDFKINCFVTSNMDDPCIDDALPDDVFKVLSYSAIERTHVISNKHITSSKNNGLR